MRRNKTKHYADFISLDHDCYYSIWAPVYARHPLSRFGIQLSVSLGGFMWLFVWFFAFRDGEQPFQPGVLLLNIPVALFGTYHVAGMGRRLYYQRLLSLHGMKDVASVDQVVCRKKETEWAYWGVTLKSHSSGLTFTVALISRPEIEPVKEGQQVNLLYSNSSMYMVI